MKKYLFVARNTVEEYLTYRLNFIMWRLRAVIRFLIIYFLWSAVFSTTASGGLFGFTHTQIFTYIFGAALISNLVFSTRTTDVATEINDGTLSNFLVRPFIYLGYRLGRESADKLFNLFFTIMELSLLIIILKPPFFIQNNLIFNFLAFLAIGFSMANYFILSMLLGFLGFWSSEVWAPRFILFIMLEFLGGVIFPLDILPRNLFNLLSFLPFNYYVYFPLKIYLGQLSGQEIIRGFTVCVFWLIVFWFLFRRVWRKGLKVYGAEGR